MISVTNFLPWLIDLCNHFCRRRLCFICWNLPLSLSLLQFKCQQFNKCRSTLPGVILCANRKLRPDEFVWKRNQSTQNVDFPPKLPKKKKKPFPIPFKEIKQAAKMDKKLASKGIEKPLEPPKNGLLVPDLVPVAYEVFDAWKLLIKGLSQLLHVIPVYGCRYTILCLSSSCFAFYY